MAYKKSLNWYVSRELRPVAKKMQSWINKRGTPKVKVLVTAKAKPVLFIAQPYYAKFQDKGVKGVERGKSLAGYKYKKGYNPADVPSAKHFKRYGEKYMYGIAQKIYKDGIPAKKYIMKGWGHFAPQVTAAIKRGGTKYIKTEIMPEPGVHKIKV